MNAAAPADVAVAGDDDTELDERRLAMTADVVAPLRWRIYAAALFVGLVAWDGVPAVLVLAWLVAVALGREVRVHGLQRLASDRKTPVQQRLTQAKWLTLAIGLTQGAAAGFIGWTDLARDALITMVLVSLSAGALSTTALIPGAFAIYAGCLLLPTVAMWALSMEPFGIGIAVLTLMFYGVQQGFAETNRRTFEESFRIRRENEMLVRELAAARDAAEAASRAKTRFLAAASHDLRQPLHALALQSAALSLDPRAADTPAIARAISTAIERLSALLDSLLDISKLDAGTIAAQVRPIRLSRLVQSVGEGFRAVAEAKGLSFTLVCPRDIVGLADPILLERLLRNLLDNAVKYTASGAIVLELRLDGGAPRIELADTGCGIPPELQQRVFEEFYQVDPGGSGGSERGLGLGLSIVHRLSALLGISLEMSSKPGQGTRFVLALPAVPPAVAAEEAPAPPPAAELHGLQVLVVDDEPAVRDATATLLSRLGCEVAVAGDGDGAVAAAALRAPAVVLTDYRLRGGETGIALAARLRAHHPGLPVLLVSGDTAPDRLRDADASGLPLLHKPLSAEALRAAVATAAAGRTT